MYQLTTRLRGGRGGFTLPELLIASSLGALVIGSAMMSYMQGMQIWQRDTIVNELNMDLETSLEAIRADLRLIPNKSFKEICNLSINQT